MGSLNLQQLLILLLLGYAAGITMALLVLVSTGGRYRQPTLVIEREDDSGGMGCLGFLTLVTLFLALALVLAKGM